MIINLIEIDDCLLNKSVSSSVGYLEIYYNIISILFKISKEPNQGSVHEESKSS